MGAPKSDELKKKIIADYAQMKSLRAVARANNVSASTVKRICDREPELKQLATQKNEQNALDMLDYMDSKKERVQEIIDVYLGALTDPAKLSDATLREITTALGTLIDKWTKLDSLKQGGASAHTTDMQTLADLLQHPVPDRSIKDFEE